MADVALIVNGRRFSGWESVSLTRTIESIAGSFSADVADRESDDAAMWPIFTEDEFTLEVDEEVCLDGWISGRSLAFDEGSRSISIEGKSRSSALVECSAVLSNWTFRKKKIAEIARKLAAPYGIPVTVQSGLELLEAPSKVVVSQGDSVFTTLESIAKASGVLLVDDGAGGILITRSGSVRASEDLIEGENLIAGSVKYDASERFYRYIVSSQIPSTDNASGKAARVRAEAIDLGVSRSDRSLLIRPDKGLTADYARQRADWEARIRAAKSSSASVGVHGWKQSDGTLWPVNSIVYVYSPTLEIDGQMIISRADHVKGGSGERTTLSLVRPDAFTPEPKARVKG